MIAAALVVALGGVAAVAWVTGDGSHALELAKEFGGGFAAYWTHHLFHKVWHATEHVRVRKGGRP